MEEEIAADVRSVLGDRGMLSDAIDDVRARKLQGEQVQSEVVDLLDNHDPLRRLAEYSYRCRGDEDAEFAATVQDVAAEGHLDRDEVEAFLEFWADVDWVVDAVEVDLKNLGGLQRHWSGVEMAPDVDNPELFEYRLRWGVDTQIEADVPASRIVQRAVTDLGTILGYLEYWDRQDGIDDEYVEYLAEQFDAEWAAEALGDIAERFGEFTGHSGSPQVVADPEVSVFWSSDAGGQHVVGTLTVTPPGSVEDSDEEDRPRGFQ